MDLNYQAYIQQEDASILSDDINLWAKDALLGSDSTKWENVMQE